MSRLLRDLDYLRVIQQDNLDQITESNQQVKLDVEQSAQAEMISYLAQRYKVKEVFSDTTVFDISLTYKGKNLVEFTAPAFSQTTHYTTNDYTLYNGYIYKCTVVDAHGAFNAVQWNKICIDRQLYYVTLPYNEFDYTVNYEIGDHVWFADKTYTCQQRCKNVDPTNSAFWGTGTTYSVNGFYPDDSSKWTKGDNRNQQVVLFLLDITLYHLHSRINPRNVPDLRKERYNGNSPTDSGGAIGWLKSVAHGNVNADLPEYAPSQGLAMRYGNAATFDSPSTNMMW